MYVLMYALTPAFLARQKQRRPLF